jgi:hypothetical protein
MATPVKCALLPDGDAMATAAWSGAGSGFLLVTVSHGKEPFGLAREQFLRRGTSLLCRGFTM